MIRYIFILIFTFNIVFAVDLADFEYRQKILLDVKKVVQDEESIARAYEQYILDNYKIPVNISALYTSSYLGLSTDFLDGISNFSTNFNTFNLGENYISYGLKDTLTVDTRITSLYESNTFRKRTYYRNNKIYIVLEDYFAKHLYDLIEQNGSGLSTCIGLSNIACIKDNHIYIKPTYTLNEITDFLISYHIDKFKTGPIIITSNTALHITRREFDSIPKGAILYDTTGAKFVKTNSGIEGLK